MDQLSVEHDGLCTRVVFQSPHNSLTHELIGSLGQVLQEHMLDGMPPVLTLRGQGQALFSPGFHLPWAVSLDRDKMRSLIAEFEDLYLNLLTHPKPTLALLNGHALAGGCILASCCDFRTARRGVRIGMTPLNRTLAIPRSAQLILTRILGPSQARGPLFLGRSFESDEALALNWIDRQAPLDDWQETIDETVSELARVEAGVYRTVKSTCLEPLLNSLTETDPSADRERFLNHWFSDQNRKRLGATLRKLGLTPTESSHRKC